MTKRSPLLDALDHESYEWLTLQSPMLAEAVETEVLAGKSPAQIRRMVLQHVGIDRLALAERCAQAASYIARGQA